MKKKHIELSKYLGYLPSCICESGPILSVWSDSVGLDIH